MRHLPSSASDGTVSGTQATTLTTAAGGVLNLGT
jgi:hypothetical protein